MCKEGNNFVDRQRLNFAHVASVEFGFLASMGFKEFEVQPTFLSYKKGVLFCNIYHGRSSWELGFEIGHEGEMFSITELIRATDRVVADKYRNAIVTDAPDLKIQLQKLSDLAQKYGERAFRDDPVFFDLLRRQRKEWSEQYSLDVLEDQVRPKAEEAFRMGRYQEAADLYEKIRGRLSETELKKLELAKNRI